MAEATDGRCVFGIMSTQVIVTFYCFCPGLQYAAKTPAICCAGLASITSGTAGPLILNAVSG